jgi:hypothetical protein
VLVLAACCAALVGCGNDEKRTADEARFAAEKRALVALLTMQSQLDAAQKSYAAGDATRAGNQVRASFAEQFSIVRGPLKASDADLAASLEADIGERLAGGIDTGAPRDEVTRLFEQIQGDLITAADAIQA